MKFEREIFVNYAKVRDDYKIKNVGVLKILEKLAGEHGASVHDGVIGNDFRWFLIAWHVRIHKRPQIEDYLTAKTWSSHMRGFQTYREFEVTKDGEIVITALSSWSRVTDKDHRLVRIDKELYDRYQSEEDYTNFEKFEIEKIVDPLDYDCKVEFTCSRNYLDANKHMNNVSYLEMINEILPENLYTNFDFNEFIIHYREQIVLNEKVICCIKEYDDCVIIIVKSFDEQNIKSTVKLFK